MFEDRFVHGLVQPSVTIVEVTVVVEVDGRDTEYVCNNCCHAKKPKLDLSSKNLMDSSPINSFMSKR